MKTPLVLPAAGLAMMILSSSSEAAAPIATTIGASNITTTAATLHGLVTPRSAGPPPSVATEAPTNLVVTNLSMNGVRAAIEQGGTITFACDGVLALSNQLDIANDVVLDASG